MRNAAFRDVRACVFDAYGTLFDHSSAALRFRDDLGDKIDRLNSIWREKQLQYTWLRTLQDAYVDFWQVTGDALDFAMDSLELRNARLRDRLMSQYLELEIFPDVKGTLTLLKEAGMKTAILSNGSSSMLRSMVEYNSIGHLFDGIFSAEEVGVFKPHPKIYALAGERLGTDPRALLFHSANAWDAYAASAFGMRVVWCNRYGLRKERLPGTPELEVKSLAEVPAIISKEN
jgi:2-haloacid dehalogenase